MDSFWRRSGVVIAALLLGAIASGCGGDDETTGLTCGSGTHASGGRCVANAVDGGGGTGGGSAGSGGSSITCGAGTHEDNGTCVADDPDAGLACGAGTHEDNGECVANEAGTVDASVPPGPIGAACTGNAQCESGFCAGTGLDPRLTDGYCTILACGDTNPCPAGSTCVAVGALKACFASCDPGTVVCRDTLVCQPLSTDPLAAICAPGCAADADCPAGGVCETATSICTPPPTCDPGAPSCPTDFSCFPTTVSPTGGYCFVSCDDPVACKDSEVCQPFGPGAPDGVCVPPPCTDNADCPAGATCAPQTTSLNYCAVPEVCPAGTCTGTGETCVSGLCLSSCSAGAAGDTECTTIHPGLLCADSFGACMPACADDGSCKAGSSCFETDWVCLPTGAFPGSPCAPADATHTNPWCANVGPIEQECAAIGGASQCLPKCTLDAECQAVSSSLTCFETQGLCLPVGAFPGSPCRTTPGDECDLDLTGNDAYDMACFSGVCLVTCHEDTDCSSFNASLACYEGKGACFPACTTNAECGYPGSGMACLVSEGVCLPEGSFPGGPCKANNTCDPIGTLTQSCVSGSCVVDCNDSAPQTGDGLCHAVNAALTCMPTNPATGAGSCVYACAGGMCPTGYTCLEPEGTKTGAQNACLPNGSFPGSACATGDVCGSYGGKAMTCASNTCVITCAAEADCTPVGLTCVEAKGVCLQPCVAGACSDNRYACLASENACLPKGSFPGGPCNENDACSDYGPLPMACAAGTCLVTCSDAAGGDTVVCPGVNAALTCDDTYTHACMIACQSGLCPAGMSCAPGNACLPTGSFPGGACRSTDPKCDSDIGGNPDHDLVCAGTACVVDCSWNPGVCADFTGLTCQSAGAGFACLP